MPTTSRGLIRLAADVAADVAHIGLVVFLMACAVVRKVQYTNVALLTVGFLLTWPPAAYALLVLAGSGALLLDQDDSASAAAAASRGFSVLKLVSPASAHAAHPPLHTPARLLRAAL